MSDYGVDLTGDELRISEAEYNAKDRLDRDTLLIKKTRSDSPKAWNGRSLDDWASDVTALDDRELSEDLFNPGVPRNKIPGLSLALGPSTDPSIGRVFAVPSGLPPVVRNLLPEILNGGDGVSVEAGLALVLESYGRRERDPLPGMFATLTPSGAGHELTLVDAVFREGRKGGLPTLVLTCKRTIVLRRDGYEDLLDRAKTSEECFEKPRQLISLQGPTGDLAGAIAKRLGWRGIPWILGPYAIANGAARLLHNRDKPRYLGNLADWIVIERCLPQPLGVLATVSSCGEERWCWRKLLEAGHALTAESSRPEVASPRPSRKPFLLLAECRNPGFHDSKWIGQGLWKEADLHWLATPQTIRRPDSQGSDRSRWVFRQEAINTRRTTWIVTELPDL